MNPPEASKLTATSSMKQLGSWFKVEYAPLPHAVKLSRYPAK